MGRALITIIGFTAWGTMYGGGLGLLAGTLILPGFGTMYAGMWGVGLGIALGLLTGIIMTISDVVLKPGRDLVSYRRMMTAAIGVLTAIGTPLLVFLTSENVLWNRAGSYLPGSEYGLASLIAAAIGGGLAAAYTTARHVDHDTLTTNDRIDQSVVGKLIEAAFNRWTFAGGIIAGALANLYTLSQYAPGSSTFLNAVLSGATLGAMAAVVNILLLGLANGMLLLFVNRLYFKEYAPHLTLDQYKTRVSILMFIFTLFAGAALSAFVFVPFTALMAVMAARGYADWLYHGEEKFKRKQKEAYMPAHALETDDLSEDDLPEDDDIEQPARRTR